MTCLFGGNPASKSATDFLAFPSQQTGFHELRRANLLSDARSGNAILEEMSGWSGSLSYFPVAHFQVPDDL